MALLSVIRRWHLRDKISIREIARRTKLSRNTIAKYLASGETCPRHPPRKSPSRLDPYAAELSRWLRTNQQQPRKPVASFPAPSNAFPPSCKRGALPPDEPRPARVRSWVSSSRSSLSNPPIWRVVATGIEQLFPLPLTDLSGLPVKPWNARVTRITSAN